MSKNRKAARMIVNSVPLLTCFLLVFAGCQTESAIEMELTPVSESTTTTAESKELPPADWENPQLVGRNRLSPHATMMIYPDIESESPQ